MKRLVLLSVILVSLFSCSKDSTQKATNYNKAVEGMGFKYNKAYVFFFIRQTVDGTVNDSDRVIFRPNGTVSEVGNRFDSASYVFPDTLTYVVNTSFDNGIYWNLNPNVNLFNFFPINDGVTNKFLLHDYLNTCVVSLYRPVGSTGLINIKATPTLKDSISTVTGYLKQ